MKQPKSHPVQRDRRCNVETLERRDLLSLYPLVNAGFESPNLSPENGYHGSVDGWVASGFPGTTYEVPWADPSPAAEGEQYVYGDSDGWSISQSGPTIAANTRYILSLDLHALDTGTTETTVVLQQAGGGTILQGVSTNASPNPAMRQISLVNGEWNHIKIGLNSRDIPQFVGSQLEISINGSRLAVDNVKLNVYQGPLDFYISSSSGSNSNDGLSAEAPLRDFDHLASYLPLIPGERILLKAGDQFTQELNIRGKGEQGNLVQLTSYGEGPNPVIRRQDLTSDIGVVWNNASYAHITNIDVEHAKLGIYLRYEFTDMGSRDVTIEHSNFRDLSDPTLNPEDHNFEFAWSDAIFVGGQAWQDAELATRLENLTIRNVTSVNAAHLFGTAWYYPEVYRSRLRNLIIEDSVAINNLGGAFQLFNVDGGHIKRVKSIGGGGQDTWSGTTLGFIQSSQNFLIEDNLFQSIDRAQSADGSGMDFEGDTHNVTFRNNVVHSNDGSAVLILSTGGRNTNLVIEDNTFYNNALDPWNSEINSEIQGSNDNHTGIIRNNGIYRGDASINYLSPNSNWSGFTITDNRQLEYEDVRSREISWDFNTDGDFEGWAAFNHWAGAAVTGGSLVGQSSDSDPYVYSPATWFDTSDPTYVWVRMSQTAGDFAQVFYITDDDPVWDGDKSVFFPINSDGQMHDYFVDLASLIETTGVITQIRLDPTIEAGSDMAIDLIRITSSNDPNQAPAAAPLPEPQQALFTSIAIEDGYLTESAQNSGVGGSRSRFSNTFRIGDDSSNRAYRPVLSFDTSSLPDNAIVTQATLGITRDGNMVGSIPIGIPNSQYGDLLVDIATPSFDGESLSNSDWQAAATQEGVSKFAWPAYLDGMTIFSRLEKADNDLINTTGKTQYRIRYAIDDDGDSVADYVPYASGNHPDAAMRPTLNIEYFVPSTLPGDYDLNGVVDRGDYSTWKANFGSSEGLALLADGNGNGVVDLADYTIWRNNLGAVAPAAQQSADIALAALSNDAGEDASSQPSIEATFQVASNQDSAAQETPTDGSTTKARRQSSSVTEPRLVESVDSDEAFESLTSLWRETETSDKSIDTALESLELDL